MSGRRTFLAFAIPLAAVPAVARVGRLLFFGIPVDGVLVHPAPWLAAISGMITYGLSIAGVLVLGLAIHVFSAVFNGEKALGPAMKLAVVASIPGWLGGAVLILPALGLVPPLGALSAMATLYGLYVLYLGLPPVMHVSRDKTPVYAGVAILVFLALWGAQSLTVAVFDKVVMTPAIGSSVNIGQGARVDIGTARKTLDSALSSNMPRPPAITPDELETLLPAGLDSGFVRQTVSSSSAHLGKLSGSMAQGSYKRGDDVLTLSIADTGVLGGLADAVKLATNKHTATGYQKSGEVEGRMTLEKYDRPTNQGEFNVLVANRFLVQAKGNATVETLQAAVRATDFARLEAMAKG